MFATKTIKVSLPRLAFKSEDRYLSYKGKEKIVVSNKTTAKVDFLNETAELVSTMLDGIVDSIINRLYLFTVNLYKRR